MNKTIISMFVSLMAVFLIVSPAQASFNSPGAMPTVTVTNASVTPCSAGRIDGCWKTSTTARPGDVIAVHIYYKNTGSSSEEGIVRLSPSRSGTAVRFSGGVNGVTSTANVSLSQAQQIAYMEGSDAACWQTSPNGGCRSVNEDALFGSGFSVGTVEPGQQGVIVARFLVAAAADDNDDDDDTDYDDECEIDSFTVDGRSSVTIDEDDSALLRWTTTSDCDYVRISSVSGNLNEDGSRTVRPSNDTTYRLTAYPGGDTATVRVSVDEDTVETNSRPQAITTIATIFGSTSAQLNGIAVPNTNTGSTSAWFEWGPASSLGYRTSSKNISSGSGSTPYGDTVNGLVPGTTYYYRAVVQNQNGTAYGSIVPFRTQNSVQGTTVVQGPTRVVVQTIRDSVTAESAPSLLELRVESAYDNMCVGGEMEYVVTYRNISTLVLEDTVLRIALPKELTYAGANRGSFDPIDNIVTLDIGRVQPGEEGAVTVRARVNENAIRGNLTVMTATVVYTNPVTRAQEDAIAYSLITVSDECPTVLGASVVGFGSFLPDTLLEWLLLILVILALILLGRNLYKKKEENR